MNARLVIIWCLKRYIMLTYTIKQIGLSEKAHLNLDIISYLITMFTRRFGI